MTELSVVFPEGLIERLPTVSGTYSANAPLKRLTWFRTGGPAEVLYMPKNIDDLYHFMSNKHGDIPVKILGLGSNVIIRDGGVPGVVVHLGKAFSAIETYDTKIIAGAGAANLKVASLARDCGLGGFTFLSGIPGTIGGAVFMNAGCYGSEVKDILQSVRVINSDGTMDTVSKDDLNIQYRSGGIEDDRIILGAVMAGTVQSKVDLAHGMEKLRLERANTQPIQEKTGGSTFRNPNRNTEQHNRLAWELIDDAGCRGLVHGGAKISEKHCNFIINFDDATAEDIEQLGAEVVERVANSSGISLEWEIERIGITLDEYMVLYGGDVARPEGGS